MDSPPWCSGDCTAAAFRLKPEATLLKRLKPEGTLLERLKPEGTLLES